LPGAGRSDEILKSQLATKCTGGEILKIRLATEFDGITMALMFEDYICQVEEPLTGRSGEILNSRLATKSTRYTNDGADVIITTSADV